MAITVPATWPSPDPAQFVARSPIVGADVTTPSRCLRNLGRAQNYLRTWGGTSPSVMQEWQDSRFTDANVRSGGAPPEGFLRCRWRIPVLPYRTEIRVGVRATSNAGSASLVEFEALSSGAVAQIAIPVGSVGAWIWSDGGAIPHLAVTPGGIGPTAPGWAAYDEIRMYTSGDAANAYIIHAVLIQQLAIPLMTYGGSWWQPLDDDELGDDDVLASRLGRILVRNGQHFSERDIARYPRMLWSWSAVRRGVGGWGPPADLADWGMRNRRGPRIVTPGGDGTLRSVEAHCYLGDSTLMRDALFRLVIGQPMPGDVGDPGELYAGANVLRFDRPAASGLGWDTPRIGYIQDRADIEGPAGHPFRAVLLEAMSVRVGASTQQYIESFSLWGV